MARIMKELMDRAKVGYSWGVSWGARSGRICNAVRKVVLRWPMMEMEIVLGQFAFARRHVSAWRQLLTVSPSVAQS